MIFGLNGVPGSVVKFGVTVLQLMVLLLGLSSNPARAARGNRIALLVSAQKGKYKDPLSYTAVDVERMNETLSLVSKFAIETLNDPTKDELEKTLARIQKEMTEYRQEHPEEGKQTSVFLFYFSGHGGDRELHSNAEVLSSPTLYKKLQDFKADIKLGIIDSCRSGSFTNTKGKTSNFYVSELRGTVILTSSGENEDSHEYSAWTGSAFTHHLVSGLRGAADQNRDNYVDLDELYKHVVMQARFDAEHDFYRQTPREARNLSVGNGSLLLAEIPKIPKGFATITYPQNMSPQTCLAMGGKDKTKLMVLSRSNSAQAVRIALETGPYLLKCTHHDKGKRVEEASFFLKSGETQDVSELTFGESKGLSAGTQLPALSAGTCTFEISAQYLYIERDQRTGLSNFEGLLELQGRFSAARVRAPPYPSASSVVTAGQGQTVWSNQFITNVVVDKTGHIPLTVELSEVEYGGQGEDDEGYQQAFLDLDCDRPEALADVRVPLSADAALERSGSVIVRYNAIRR